MTYFSLYMCFYVSSLLDGGSYSSPLHLAGPSWGRQLQQGLSGLCSFPSVGPGCLRLYLVPVVGLKPLPRKVLLS